MDERTIQARLKQSDTPSHRLQIHREHLGPMCKLLKHLGNMLHPYLLVLRVKSKERRTLDRVLLSRHFWDLRDL